MKRIAIICLLLAGLGFAWGSPMNAQEQSNQQAKTVAPHSMTECGSECKTCETRCEKTLSYCLKQGGKHIEGKHIAAMKDCIATCKTSHELMTRGSDLSPKACSLCAEACKRCAESCAQFKDKAMQDCAEECRKCEQSCTKMAS